MTGQELYEVTVEESERIHATNPRRAGEPPMDPWDELHPAVQHAWDELAVAQMERDQDVE